MPVATNAARQPYTTASQPAKSGAAIMPSVMPTWLSAVPIARSRGRR